MHLRLAISLDRPHIKIRERLERRFLAALHHISGVARLTCFCERAASTHRPSQPGVLMAFRLC
jgi:hypothetical protein